MVECAHAHGRRTTRRWPWPDSKFLPRNSAGSAQLLRHVVGTRSGLRHSAVTGRLHHVRHCDSPPAFGRRTFPVADHAAGLALLVAGLLIAKVLLEEAAARWFPERLATVTQEADWPGIAQQVLSAIIRLAIFLFVSAAFIGMPWQLWAGGLIWFVPLALAPFATRLPNAPRLWQVLPQSVPYLSLSLLLYLILASVLGNAFGDSTTFALMSFFILLIPDLILGVLFLFGREPVEGDVRWYLRPSMVLLYRAGGVVVLGLAIGLAARSLF